MRNETAQEKKSQTFKWKNWRKQTETNNNPSLVTTAYDAEIPGPGITEKKDVRREIREKTKTQYDDTKKNRSHRTRSLCRAQWRNQQQFPAQNISRKNRTEKYRDVIGQVVCVKKHFVGVKE